MKFLKEQTRKQKAESLKESVQKVEDFIFDQISTYLDKLEGFLDYLEVYTNDRASIIQSNTFNKSEIDRNEELGKYLLHSLKLINIIQDDVCDAIETMR